MTPLEILFASLSIFLMLFLFFLGRYLMRADKRGEEQARGLELVLRGVRKAGQLAYANAVAHINGEVNGEMKKAVEGYQEYMEELDKHLEKQAFRK